MEKRHIVSRKVTKCPFKASGTAFDLSDNDSARGPGNKVREGVKPERLKFLNYVTYEKNARQLAAGHFQ